MAEEGKRNSGCLGKALLAGILIIILRANLPPDNVAESMDLSDRSAIGGFFVKMVASEFVADWEYTDLGIVKIAHSERLDLTAIGLPFSKWTISKDK